MKEASEGKDKVPEWISTHPSDDTRIKKLEEFMPVALKEYEKAKQQPPAPATASTKRQRKS